MRLTLRPTILTAPPGSIGYDAAMREAKLDPRLLDLVRERYLPRLTGVLRKNSTDYLRPYMEEPCWQWARGTTKDGWPALSFRYARAGLRSEGRRASRMHPAEIWLALVSIPATLSLEPARYAAPRCGDRLCVNPAHFKELTEREYAQWQITAGPPLVVEGGIRVSMYTERELVESMAKLEKRIVGVNPKDAARKLIEAGWRPKDIKEATGMSLSWIYKERTKFNA